MGATSITLTSMIDIDGNALTMSGTFGTKGFGTLEPGNGVLEEQISFTGLTTNANGTVTLSGISSVAFVSPYTETSGLAKTHAGSTTFVISNTAGFYNELVAKNDDATITATYTFTTPNYPQVDNSATMPTLQAQFATKAYVDATVIIGAPDATTSVQGLVQLPTQAQVDAGTATGSTGASLTPTPALLRSKLLSDYVIDTGVADAYVITPAPAIAAYATGQIFSFKAINANLTTTPTLNVNGKGAKTIVKVGGVALVAGDIPANGFIVVEYTGTVMQMISPAGIGLPAIAAGNINEFVGTSDGAAFSFMRPFNYQAFTGNGSWTKPTNLSGNEIVIVQTWGGGGGGGSTSGASSAGAGGGGGGSFIEIAFLASALSSTETVTVGAAVAAATAGNNTTFGSHVTAYGGAAGESVSAGTGGGGGGGAGVYGKGTVGSGGTGGAGGAPGGGAARTDAAGFGGGGGSSSGATVPGRGVNGGGGGASGGPTSSDGDAGANSIYGGGGGGGGGGSTHSGGAGGTGLSYGGSGASGGNAGVNGGDGTAPAGGGGGAGSGTKTGGGGARGEVRVWVVL